MCHLYIFYFQEPDFTQYTLRLGKNWAYYSVKTYEKLKALSESNIELGKLFEN